MKLKNQEIKLNNCDGLYGYKSTTKYVIRVCPQCKAAYRRYPSEIEYIADDQIFCSWNCKKKYLKSHEPKIVDGFKNVTTMRKDELVKEIFEYDKSRSLTSLFRLDRSALMDRLKELRKRGNNNGQ